MIITIPMENYCGLTEFYDEVATEMDYTDISELHYDCRKINISKNIQDAFYKYYAQKANEQYPAPSENDIRISVTMLLAISGPKVDFNLKASEVEIFDGFIC